MPADENGKKSRSKFAISVADKQLIENQFKELFNRGQKNGRFLDLIVEVHKKLNSDDKSIVNSIFMKKENIDMLVIAAEKDKSAARVLFELLPANLFNQEQLNRMIAPHVDAISAQWRDQCKTEYVKIADREYDARQVSAPSRPAQAMPSEETLGVDRQYREAYKNMVKPLENKLIDMQNNPEKFSFKDKQQFLKDCVQAEAKMREFHFPEKMQNEMVERISACKSEMATSAKRPDPYTLESPNKFPITTPPAATNTSKSRFAATRKESEVKPKDDEESNIAKPGR